jgi:hypothetical protein
VRLADDVEAARPAALGPTQNVDDDTAHVDADERGKLPPDVKDGHLALDQRVTHRSDRCSFIMSERKVRGEGKRYADARGKRYADGEGKRYADAREEVCGRSWATTTGDQFTV